MTGRCPARVNAGLASLVLALALGGRPSPGAQGQDSPPSSGRIAGTVVLTRALSTHKPRIRFYADYGTASPVPEAPRDVDEFANVVLYLDSVPARVAVPPHPARPAIRQRHERFEPHVLAVTRGTTVEFPNLDDVFHNVFSLSSAKTFDLGRYPKGASKAVTFDRTGIVQVFCHIHADMSAVVLVLNTPYFTSPDSGGRFEIAEVPPGMYRLVAWHERIKPLSVSVTVRAGQVTTLALDIPLPADHAKP